MRDPSEWPEDMPQDIRDAIEAGMASAERQYREMELNAERYRKLRELPGKLSYAVIEIKKCVCYSQVVFGSDLDAAVDSMEAADAKPQ